jgi:hypothetical protein
MTNGKLEKHLRLTRWLMTRLVIVACLYFAFLTSINVGVMRAVVRWSNISVGFDLLFALSSAYPLAYLGIMVVALLKELFVKRDIDSIVINIVLLVVAIGGLLFLLSGVLVIGDVMGGGPFAM